MPMGAEQVDGLQVIDLDISDDSGAFFVIHGTAVDDDTLFCLVADNITVFSQHVTGEPLDNHSEELEGEVNDEFSFFEP